MIKGSILAFVSMIATIATCAIAQEPAGQGQTDAAMVVPADQQPTGEQLNRLFEVMRIKEQIAATSKMMPQLVQQQFSQQVQQVKNDHPELARLTPRQQEASSKVIANFMQQAMALYTGDEMLADMKAIYQRHLTGNDVENLITFYNSTTGQHLLNMVPVVMQEFMPAVMQKMQSRMRPLIVEMSKNLADIAASPDSANKPSQDKPDQR